MAAGIYNAKALPRGLPPAESAGVFAVPGDPVTPNAAAAAAEYGADISGHRARIITAELLRDCDRVYCMTPSHLAALTALFPDCAAKCRLLDEQGVPDPYGGDLACYRRTAAAISAAVDAIIGEAQP